MYRFIWVLCLNLCIPHSNARGATPRPRPGLVAERSYPTSKVRRGGREERPHVQGKRNSSKMGGVARGRQRADRLKPQSQKTSQSAHRTTALSNSVRLSHAMWGHPRWSGHGGEVGQNVVHWRRECQTTSVFLP